MEVPLILAVLMALHALSAPRSETVGLEHDAPDSGTTESIENSTRSSAYPLRFDSEIVRLTIVGDSLEVDGTYVLACERPYRQLIPLIYPFPADSMMAGARMIEGHTRVDGDSWEPLRFDPLPGGSGVRWWVPPCSGRTIEIRGRYRQAMREAYARYIVTTTRLWQRPLRHARFEIRLPEGATPAEFSFPFSAEADSLRDPAQTGDGDPATVYVWETESFYPDRDIVVRWQQ